MLAKNWAGRYSKGLRNQNGEHLVNLCESSNFETQVLVLYIYSELARTLFPFKSKNNIKIKITCQRFIGNEYILAKFHWCCVEKKLMDK